MFDPLDEIKKLLLSRLEEAEVHILDPRQDKKHLEAVIVSAAFRGLSLLEQHRIVKKILKGAFDAYLHALSIKTFTPEEWEKNAKQ